MNGDGKSFSIEIFHSMTEDAIGCRGFCRRNFTGGSACSAAVVRKSGFAHLSLAPGLSQVSAGNRELAAVSTAFRPCSRVAVGRAHGEAAETAPVQTAGNTQLKPDANEIFAASQKLICALCGFRNQLNLATAK